MRSSSFVLAIRRSGQQKHNGVNEQCSPTIQQHCRTPDEADKETVFQRNAAQQRTDIVYKKVTLLPGWKIVPIDSIYSNSYLNSIT